MLQRETKMKKIIEKHEDWVCYILIAVYVIVNSYCMQNFGLTDYRSVVINTIFSAVLLVLIIYLKRVSYYGLTKVTDLKSYLYFIPLLLIVSVNLWNGLSINNTFGKILCHILTMLNVGFLEEIIFRGFLFKMMAKSNVKSAIIVSSVTFGIGHIVNLLNGGRFHSDTTANMLRNGNWIFVCNYILQEQVTCSMYRSALFHQCFFDI